MKDLVFHKIRNTECDFCGEHKDVVTSVNEYTYICAKCAKEINKHARINELVVKEEKETETIDRKDFIVKAEKIRLKKNRRGRSE